MSLPALPRERLHLLFAVLAWLVPRQSASIDEIARQFGLRPKDVVALVELAACCGIPPYTADTLLDLYVDGDRVEANLGNLLGRPRRLSAPEGFALAASVRAILAVRGADPDGTLRSALGKLERALGDRPRLSVEMDDPLFLDGVRRAWEERRQIEIDYYSASRDEVSTRRIEPLELFTVDGHWYVDAYCHRAGGVRHFRLDRIRSLVATDAPFSHRVDVPEGNAPAPGFFEAGFFEAVPEVEIEIPVALRWAVETSPTRSITEIGERRLRVVLPMAGVPWLERLMLVLGAEASVVSPVELSAVGSAAAAKVRALYG